MKKPLAHRVTVPSTRIPLWAGEAIAAIQNLRELGAAEACHREERCRLHLDGYTSLALSPRHPRAGLSIHRVGGPGLAADVIVIVLPQYCLDRQERASCWCDFARRRQVVIRCTLVANRRGRYDDTSDAYGPNKDPRASAGDEFATSERDHVLQTRRCAGSADSWMNDGEPSTSIIELVDRIISCFALAIVHVTRVRTLMHEFRDDFLEKAQHTMLCDIDGLDDTTRLDDRDARTVTFEQWDAGVLRVLAGARFRIEVARASGFGSRYDLLLFLLVVFDNERAPGVKATTAGSRFSGQNTRPTAVTPCLAAINEIGFLLPWSSATGGRRT
jgi:hypothetical protein